MAFYIIARANISRIHDQLRRLHEGDVIDRVMIRDNNGSIVTRQSLGRKINRPPTSERRMFAGHGDFWNERIEVVDGRSAILDQLDQLQCRALAHVVDVLLVSYPDDQDTRPAQPFLEALVQRLGQPRNNQMGHIGVDLAREFDESGGHVVLSRLPGQIVYILKRPLVTMAIVATPGLYKLVSTGELDVGSFHALGGSVQPGFSSLPHNPFYVLILFTSPFLALFLCCIDCTKKQAGYGAALLPSLFLIVCWPVVLTFTTTVPYLYYYGRYLIIEILPVSIIAIALSARAAAFAPLVARTLLGFGIMWCAGFSLAQLDFAQGESGSPFHRIADRMKPGDILIVDGPSVSGSVFVIPLRYALGVPSFILPPTDECRRSHLVAQLRSITDGVLYVLSDKPLFTLAGVTEQPTLVDSIPYGSNRLWAGNRVSQWLLPFRNRYSVDFKATLFKVRRDVGRMYCLGETVSMAARHSSAQYLVSGWSEQEEAHRWSIGKSAVLNLKLTHPPAPTKTLELRMKAFAFAGQTVEIVVDGETIARRFLTSTPEEIVLPFSAAVLKGGNVVIEFKTPESKSPSELGSSRDLRVLGIGIQSFALEQQP